MRRRRLQLQLGVDGADERARDAELALKMALRAPWIQALSADNVTLSWTLEDPDTPLPVRVRLSLSRSWRRAPRARAALARARALAARLA
mgnify:CR=1 FL=1